MKPGSPCLHGATVTNPLTRVSNKGMSTDMTEDELADRVRAASGGDKEAARAVLEAIQDDVYGLALRMLGHPVDAEDAAQEILLIVLTNLGSFRGESAFRPGCGGWRRITSPASEKGAARRSRSKRWTIACAPDFVTSERPPRPGERALARSSAFVAPRR